MVMLYQKANHNFPFSIILGISLCHFGDYVIVQRKIIRKFVMF